MSFTIRLVSLLFLSLLLLVDVASSAEGPSEGTPQVPPPGESPEDGVKSYKGAQVLRLASKAKDLLESTEEIGDVETWGRNTSHMEIIVSEKKLPEVKSLLTKEGFTWDIVIDDVQKAIIAQNPNMTEDEFDELTGKHGHRMTFQAYHRYNDIHGYLDYLGQTYPNRVSIGTLGNSIEGRPLKYVKISSGESNAKGFWIDGGIHAREWISPAVVSYIISELVENSEAHGDSFKGIDFYILPILNPDGYEYTHTYDRLWRKNRRKSSYLCVGTDLNRNWGYKWGGKGASKQQCKEIYGGTKAFSEPETTAVSNFILQNIPRAQGFVTFHSYGQYILYPFGYDVNQPASDSVDLERVGRKAAQAIASATGAHYTVGNSAQTLYPASGGADDWAKGIANIKYTYTIELRDRGGYGFLLPAQFITPTAKEALAAIKAISEEIQQLP